MTAFSAAMDLLFQNNDLAADATYTPAAAPGDSLTVRAIRMAPSDVAQISGARIHVETDVFHVRQSDVASPRPGDALTLGGVTYRVQGEPEEDELRLFWVLDTYPD